jgi:hypothetical protein
MTPRQFHIYVEEVSKSRQAQYENERQSIYLTAALTAQFVWSKKLPKYEKVFGICKQPMTDEQMYEAVKQLQKKFEECEEWQ